MKKNFVLAYSLSLVALLSSCSNDMNNGQIEDNRTGNLTLDVGFNNVITTKAVSTAKPTTNWSDVKNVDVFFCNPSTGEIVATKNIAKDQLDNSGAISTPKKVMFKDIKVGTYDIYAFANSQDPAMVPIPAKQGDAPLWSFGAVRGMNINDVKMRLKATNKEVVGSTEQQLYDKAVNLFSDKAAAVNITAGNDVQVPIELERNVSLLRIRINKNGYATSFTDNQSFVKVMNNPLEVSSLGSILNSHQDKHVIKEVRGFATQNPTTGYDGGTVIDAQNTEWIDVIIPAGSRNNLLNGFKRTYIVLKGKKGAEDRFYGFYLPLLPDNSWTYTKPNAIFDISLKLTSDGEITEPEIPAVVGNVDVNVSVLPWGNIEHHSIEI